jgi:hypothetical protein
VDKPFNTRLGFARKEQQDFHAPGGDPRQTGPQGLYGVGAVGGAAGFLVVAAVMLTAFFSLPPALFFFLPALFVGTIVGFILWLRHR